MTLTSWWSSFRIHDNNILEHLAIERETVPPDRCKVVQSRYIRNHLALFKLSLICQYFFCLSLWITWLQCTCTSNQPTNSSNRKGDERGNFKYGDCSLYNILLFAQHSDMHSIESPFSSCQFVLFFTVSLQIAMQSFFFSIARKREAVKISAVWLSSKGNLTRFNSYDSYRVKRFWNMWVSANVVGAEYEKNSLIPLFIK